MAAEELIKSFKLLNHVTNVSELMKEGKDSASAEMLAINKMFSKCEELLRDLPGGEMTTVQQQEEVERLKKDLAAKRKLVEKYKKLEALLDESKQSGPLKDNENGIGNFSNSATLDESVVLMEM